MCHMDVPNLPLKITWHDFAFQINLAWWDELAEEGKAIHADPVD